MQMLFCAEEIGEMRAVPQLEWALGAIIGDAFEEVWRRRREQAAKRKAKRVNREKRAREMAKYRTAH